MKRNMKLVVIILMLGNLTWIVPTCNAPSPTKQTAPTKAVEDSPEAQEIQRRVVAFLNWYKNHIQEANRIPLVDQTVGKPYSVNLKNAERYLTYLKSSNLLTEGYLDQWRVYFKERQEGFRLSPQYEGPPTGFDYDLVMLNQDVDIQLSSLISLKMGKTLVIKDKATVWFTLLDTYEFRLVRQNGRWLINEILNQSQE